jgi:predicted ArsR family transcriptional regulator
MHGVLSVPKSTPSEARGRDAVLEQLKRSGPAVAGDLAESIGVSDIAIRQHLHALEEGGLVAFREEARGRGRPTKVWALTSHAEGRFPDAHAGLSIELLDAALATFGEAGMQRMLEHRRQVQIERYRSRMPSDGRFCYRVRVFADLRSAEGRMAEIRREARGVYLLIENHCPIAAARERQPNIEADTVALFRAVLGETIEIERCYDLEQDDRRTVYRIRNPVIC